MARSPLRPTEPKRQQDDGSVRYGRYLQVAVIDRSDHFGIWLVRLRVQSVQRAIGNVERTKTLSVDDE